MSLSCRALLQAGRRPASFSKPAFLYLKRQLATDVQSPTPPFHETPSSPPPPVQITTPIDSALDNAETKNTPSVAAGEGNPKPTTGGRRKPKSKHADGQLHTIETMPFTCYQEALKIISQDRAEKLKQIAEQRKSIAGLKKLQGWKDDHPRIKRMQEFVDELLLKIDLNNPRIKYNYDNKVKIDPHRRVYQYWDDEKWRSMRRKVLMQRLTQMYIVADVLPAVDPIVDVHMRFQRKNTLLGEKLPVRRVTRPPIVQIKQFDSKERLVTVLVIDADKPNLEKDGFDFYLQWMVTNCQLSIQKQMVIGSNCNSGGRDEVAPYEVPYVHKGENYHRYCVFVLEQNGRLEIGKEKVDESPKVEKGSKAKDGKKVEGKEEETSKTEEAPKTEEASRLAENSKMEKVSKSKDGKVAATTTKSDQERIQRVGFNLRSFIAKNDLKVIGAHLWRCEFDPSMIEIMKQLGRKDWNMKYIKHPEHI
ncbi:hypothetical protein ABW20_dc0100761 [Dactylellina cionopaga]|nr:hypothetical protein ABW20_dc0100761 [Dactylellina cionopaga]